jgi:phosphatidylinositol alpha-mannosyltransferase
MRVAIVAPYDLSKPGGVNNQIRAQARALRRLGHEVRVYGPASAPLADGEVSLGRTYAVTFSGTESGLGIDPRAWARMATFANDGIDVLHVHEPFTPLAPWFALLRSSVPVVGTFHVHRERGHRWYRSVGWALRPLARRLAARIAVSEPARRTVASHFPGEYAIVPNGIDVDRFTSAAERPAAFEPRRIHVLYVGRLEPRKGVESLIRACADVQQRNRAVRLVIAGDGPDRDRLAAVAKQLSADVLFAGALRDDDLPGYFQAADIVCSPALGGESFGIVLIEAMAAARPIIASRIEGYAAVVDGTGAGVLTPAGAVAPLAAAIEELAREPDKRVRLGAAGAAAVQRYDWSAVAAELTRIYEQITQA